MLPLSLSGTDFTKGKPLALDVRMHGSEGEFTVYTGLQPPIHKKRAVALFTQAMLAIETDGLCVL